MLEVPGLMTRPDRAKFFEGLLPLIDDELEDNPAAAAYRAAFEWTPW